MAGNPHTRANWKKKFVLDRKDKDSPLVKFASYAKDKGSAGFRKDLCATDGFNAAFDAELETVNDDKVLVTSPQPSEPSAKVGRSLPAGSATTPRPANSTTRNFRPGLTSN